MKRETRFKQPIAKIKKRLHTKVSKYVRLSNAVDGYCTCCTCGKSVPWDDGCDAGHLYERYLIWTAFDIRNIDPQCRQCNSYPGGHAAKHAYFTLKKHGQEVLRELDALSRKQDLRNSVERKDWLLDIEDEIDAKLKGLNNG